MIKNENSVAILAQVGVNICIPFAQNNPPKQTKLKKTRTRLLLFILLAIFVGLISYSDLISVLILEHSPCVMAGYLVKQHNLGPSRVLRLHLCSMSRC